MQFKNVQPILLVEDSPEDYEATLRAFKRSRVVNPVIHCGDGEDALDFLLHRGRYAGGAPRPSIILLDLNLPGTDGREVLREVKGNAELSPIPVIVLTTSSNEQDVEDCYRAGANSYIQKPVNLNGLLDVVQRLKDFWFEIVLYPDGQ